MCASMYGMIARPVQTAKPSSKNRRCGPGSMCSRKSRDDFWRTIVESWKTPPEATTWFRAQGIEDHEALDATWLRSNAASSKLSCYGAGAGESLYDAIVSDARFREDFARFQLWIQPWRDFRQVVSEWRSAADAMAWAQSYGLPVRRLVDSKWLRRFPLTAEREGFKGLYAAIVEDGRFAPKFSAFSRWISQGSGDVTTVAGWRTREDVLVWAANQGLDPGCLSDETSLRGARRQIHRAILRDPRFQGSYRNFKAWLGIGTLTGNVVICWRDKSDALRWAELKGLSAEDLGSPDILRRQGLSFIVAGVLNDTRFRGDFAVFRRWLGLESDFHAVVIGWKHPEDALEWARARGITGSELGRRAWLIKTSALAVTQGGIGECLEGLLDAILQDPRFQGDFLTFRRWLGVSDWSAIVKSWKTPQDAQAWASSRRISLTSLPSSSRRSGKGLIDAELTGLVQAILADPRFKSGIRAFLSWLGGTAEG
jgi:hypothetical protein